MQKHDFLKLKIIKYTDKAEYYVSNEIALCKQGIKYLIELQKCHKLFDDSKTWTAYEEDNSIDFSTSELSIEYDKVVNNIDRIYEDLEKLKSRTLSLAFMSIDDHKKLYQ